ncbi:MAG: CRISPR-associated endonuclease Cas3'', partial [Flavobacteriales bacterium]|nr:CRISPR-associated endonuclease Cas3'' [Flavobacteriales bacterium]
MKLQDIKIAHIKDGNVQNINEHSSNVASLCRSFASSFQSETWTYIIGLLHDYGKYSSAFQQYIRCVSEGKICQKTDHSSYGAIKALELYGHPGKIMAYCIAGHHSGLPDYNSLKNRLEKTLPYELPELQHSPAWVLNVPKGLKNDNFHLWIRMMFSTLVDADFLDTEHFMSKEQYNIRGHFCSMKELKCKLDDYTRHLCETAKDTPLNKIRQNIQKLCLLSSENEKGFNTLTVPTGGGKTISSLVWAINHAVKYNKKRIIIAIPYTSIITQTATILKGIFGDENVIEHHSNVVYADDSETADNKDAKRIKLATENWDAPIIVTTNVQLFESLYANKTSSCRKLHNIAQSIIILDEVQML